MSVVHNKINLDCNKLNLVLSSPPSFRFIRCNKLNPGFEFHLMKFKTCLHRRVEMKFCEMFDSCIKCNEVKLSETSTSPPPHLVYIGDPSQHVTGHFIVLRQGKDAYC